MLLLVSYFLFLIVKRYRAFIYTAIQIKLSLLLLSLPTVATDDRKQVYCLDVVLNNLIGRFFFLKFDYHEEKF